MELVVISGKGGTGKTTIATAISELIEHSIRIDCDVDAPNLYLFYKGNNIEEKEFYAGKKAIINQSTCVECGKCEQVCKFEAIKNNIIDDLSCEGCGACTLVCPTNSISLSDNKVANAFISNIKNGKISRAEMEVGSDGSGKLITFLKNSGKRFSDNKITIVDGSPGIGCPVVSSISGSDKVLVVTEPTQSGFEDLKRIIKLCDHFKVFTMVCINKYDINTEVAYKIEEYLNKHNLKLVGKIPYDNLVMKSINELKPITQYKDSTAAKAIIDLWNNIKDLNDIK